MHKSNKTKSAVKKIAAWLFLVFLVFSIPSIYQTGKDFGAELYRFSQGGCEPLESDNQK